MRDLDGQMLCAEPQNLALVGFQYFEAKTTEIYFVARSWDFTGDCAEELSLIHI